MNIKNISIILIVTLSMLLKPVITKAVAAEGVIFSVMSDVHIKDTLCREEDRFRIALTNINSREKNLDATIIAGDLTDSGTLIQYKKFMSIYNDYGNKSAQKLFVMGNHDYPSKTSFSQAQELFRSSIGEDIKSHKVIKGFHFIQISTETGETNGFFSDALIYWLQKQLQLAKKDGIDKPIFLTIHQPIKNTVYGSDSWGNSSLQRILDNYPQVIVFSGHSHYPLNDERSIYQKNFTAIGTASLSYMELEPGKIQGNIPAGADTVSQELLVKVDGRNKVTIQRIDVTTNEEIKTKWFIERPSDKTSFKYTDIRKSLTMPPYFKPHSKIEVNNINSNSAEVIFPQAVHEDMVHSYKIKVKGIEEKEYLCFSGFYLGKKMPIEVKESLNGLKPNEAYSIKVWAIDSFGKESILPLSTTFITKNQT